MRIHSITFQAIGPFAQLQTLNLDDFTDSGLFLMWGPTGAGKSTVIDALVFALYGDVAGSRDSSKDRIRSHYAGPAVETFVEVVFSVPRGVYRLRRTPEYEREKLRGVGTTVAKASRSLYRLTSPEDEHGELVANTHDEVAAEVASLVRLDREQFLQTVVLAQGQFAAFLRATPDERRQLLQDVFGTAIFEAIQQDLVAAARAARKEIQDQDTRCRHHSEILQETLIRTIAELVANPNAQTLATTAESPAWTQLLAANDSLSAAPPTASTAPGAATSERPAAADPAAILAAAQPLLAALGEVDNQVAAWAQDAVAAHQAATDNLQAQEEVATAQEKWRELSATSANLQLAQAQIIQARAALAAAGKAELALAGAPAQKKALLRWQQAGAALNSFVWPVSFALGAEKQAKFLAGEVAPQTKPMAAELNAAADGMQEQLGQLKELAALEQGFPTREEDLAAQAKELAAAKKTLAKQQERLSVLPVERQKLVGQLAEIATAQKKLTQAEQKVSELERRVAAANRSLALTETVTLAEKSQQEAAAQLKAAHTELLQLRSAWTTATAGQLASDLAVEQPCPVCGSCTHPAPAATPEMAVTRTEVTQAEARHDQKTAQLAQASSALTEAEHALEAARQEAAGTLTDLTLHWEQAQTVVAQLQATVAGEADLLTCQDALTRETEALHTAQVDLNSQVTGLQVTIAQARTALTADKARCIQAAAEAAAENVNQAWQESRDLVADLRAGAQLLTQLAETWQQQFAATQDLTEAVSAAGFADIAAAKAAQLPAAKQKEMSAAVAAHELAVAQVEAALADPQLAANQELPPPDLAAAQAVVAEAAALRDKSREFAGEIHARSQNVAEASNRLAADLAALQNLGADREASLRVGEIAAGEAQNLTRTPLASYVLLRRFEEVLAAANPRLAEITAGRYQLQRTDQEDDQRARKFGLGLAILDHHSGKTRSPRTLSGGETFFTSLSLALALADVVQAEAGGVELGTLFIDEGFGSLDAETQDQVMNQLLALRAGGRTVGVVSHVEEMRQRIPERLEVRKAADGTATLWRS